MIKLLLPSAVAEILGVTTNTLAKWRCAGSPSLEFVKIGGRIRYPETAVANFLAAQERHRSTASVVARRSDRLAWRRASNGLEEQ